MAIDELSCTHMVVLGRVTQILLVLLGGACLAGAQETRVLFTIFGQVLQPDGRPAAGALVAISGQAGFSARALANDMGRFEIPDLARGRYRLTASNPSAPEQYSDPVDVDVGRASSFRVIMIAPEIFWFPGRIPNSSYICKGSDI
ncbi:MAG: carboxypeptidase regulatory-like domain-containing protein, partial [Acidobacteria bacterium]|nr:carboxypeptidase regulatory-like domain-containing protein [Acidobacteriota bacterium]